MFKSSARRQILAALVGANHGATVRRATLATALALSISSIPVHAAAITVDGNLSDLIGEVASNPYNVASANDPQGSADSPATENNNGFDIKNVYAFYEKPANVLYLGMNFYGKVGDSMAITDTTSTNEYLAFCATTTCNRSVFDSNETYGIQLYAGTSTAAPQLLSFNVLGASNGTDSLTVSNNPYSLTITRAVSEANNGVEFSIAGLETVLAPYGFANPANLLIRFTAGSGDSNPASSAAEDFHNMQMQVVPVPAAAWLFGSGLVGLLAAARKRQQTA